MVAPKACWFTVLFSLVDNPTLTKETFETFPDENHVDANCKPENAPWDSFDSRLLLVTNWEPPTLKP